MGERVCAAVPASRTPTSQKSCYPFFPSNPDPSHPTPSPSFLPFPPFLLPPQNHLSTSSCNVRDTATVFVLLCCFVCASFNPHSFVLRCAVATPHHATVRIGVRRRESDPAPSVLVSDWKRAHLPTNLRQTQGKTGSLFVFPAFGLNSFTTIAAHSPDIFTFSISGRNPQFVNLALSLH